jgi:endonuclease/exonuclease/phosphatase family metal-dependent hydrolase
MKIRTAALSLLLAPLAQAVSFRLATYNIGAHLMVPPDGGAVYFDYGIGAPGQPDHDKVREVLSRIHADVVALEEIHSTDVAGNPDDLDALAASLGYGYSYVAPTSGAFDPGLRVIFLSRYPFLSTASVGSPPGAKEITRLFPVVKVDIPGTTHDPILLGLHLKSGTSSQERFRRAVEMKRIVGYFAAQGITNDDNYIILGDFNPSSTNKTFTALPAGLPGAFVLGPDLPFPISYSTNPLTYFPANIPTKLSAFQLNHSPSTFDTTTTTGPTLDLFLVSTAIAGRPHATEIYNSALDISNSIGLAKNGAPPATDASVLASDHYALFADLELDSDYPNLSASVSPISLTEGGTSAATVQVSLPAALATALTVSISPDDPSALTLSATSIVIPAGSTSGSITVTAARDYLAQGNRAVTFTLSAMGYDPANAVLQVIDADAPYVFNTPGQMISESFTRYGGTLDPSPWVTSGASWLGMDDGISSVTGLRSYGVSNDGSIGVLLNASPVLATAAFTNQSEFNLTAIQINFTAEQWKAVSGGRPDALSVDLIVNGIATTVPSLSFTAATDLPSGAVSGGQSVAKTALLTGLSIPPDGTFSLRFTFTPGPIGISSPEVFINEFHYDNVGADSGEFVEIAVSSKFSGVPADISLLLYNGGDGIHYGTHALSTFSQGVTSGGHTLYSKFIAGIQNGNPDGFALVVGGTATQTISYGGSFVGTAGLANGRTFTDIGVKQTGTETAGQFALGLSGSNGSPQRFSWTKFSSLPHSPGAVNSGQTFTAPALPQGIAFDNLSVTFLIDTDQDGLPDFSDPDDDNDGQTDTDEALFGSDPLDAASIYRLIFAATTQGNARLNFATLPGRIYTVQRSETLNSWTTLAVQNGTGAVLSLPINTTLFPKAFYHIIVAYQ